MLETLRIEWEAKVILLIFVVLTVWWALLQFPATNSENLNSTFGVCYGIVALLGAIWGLYTAKLWGGWSSVVGKSMIFFALGLFFQEFGQLAYFYTVFIAHSTVTYPSIGDFGYFGSIPLYIIATLFLANASGAHLSLNSNVNKVQVLLVPIVLLSFGYILFLQGYHFNFNEPLKTFLDFGYPLGQAIYISIAILTFTLSKGFLGGIMKEKVVTLLLALFAQFLADYTFLYQTSRGTWEAGKINDFMYLFAYFIMAMALIQMKTAYDRIKRG